MDETAGVNNTIITATLEELKADTFGVADMSLYDSDLVGINGRAKEELHFAVCFGIVLSKTLLDTITDGPTQLYLHHYRQLNYGLDMMGYQLSREIERKGYKALPFAASQVVDWRRQRGHISHKKVGVLAGLGWIGRNNLLVHPVFGSQVRYNTVLTDMPLTAGRSLDRDCGACRACVNGCPGQAIKEEAESFDYKGCYEMIDKLRKERNVGHHICGICVSTCKGER